MAVVVSQDVTDLKNTEASLREAVMKLKLEQELRERFVFALTHDLRTPLTAARVSAQLLVRKKDDPAALHTLSGFIISNIDRIDRMIEDLLDANRIRAGEKIPLETTEFDLTLKVQKTLEELSIIHGKRFVLKANNPVVGHWSKQGLRRLIENLVNNAVKYGDPDQPITLSVATAEQNQVVLSVHNFGNPIPQDELPTLFLQFRRSRGAEQGIQKGWGIGLTLVRSIAEAHGGNVQVESNARDGTTFRVVLPMGLARDF